MGVGTYAGNPHGGNDAVTVDSRLSTH